jgi:rubrerythrin
MATLTVADALRMAMRLEKENLREYVKEAQESQDPALRAMFSFLAEEEKKHVALIQRKMAEHKVTE